MDVLNIEFISFGLILAASFVLILRRFDIAFYVLLFMSTLLHKELFSFYRWDLMPVRAFMLALLCAAVTKTYLWFYSNRKDISKIKSDTRDFFSRPFILLLTMLVIVRAVSIVFTKNLESSLFLFGFFTTIVALGFLMFDFFKDSNKKVIKYLKAYIYIVFASSLFGYFQFFYYEKTGVIIGSLWNIPGNLSRVGALFWDVNHFGALLAALLPVLGVLILMEKSWKTRILDSFVFLSCLGTLLLTNSRTAWIMAFIAFVSFVTMFLVKKIGLKGIGIVLGVLVLASIPLLIEYSDRSSPFRARVKQYLHYRMDSFDSHMLLLQGSFQIFEEKPVLGGGYGGFFEHFSKTKIAPVYFGRDPAALNTRVPAHTVWGQIAAETGAVGLSVFILFVSVIFFSLLYIVFTRKEPREYLIASAMGSVLIGWFTAGIFYSYNAEFFYITIFLFYMFSVSLLGQDYDIKKITGHFFRRSGAVLLILLIISSVLIFWGLGKNHLVPWDEAIYAKISKNMTETGNYIVQNWHPGVPWYEKPPLYMWMMAAGMNFFGVSSFAARLPSAMFGLVTIVGIYFFGKRTQNKTVGFFSAFSVLTSVWWLYYARASMLDVTATAFISLSLFSYYLTRDKKSYWGWLLSGTFAGFAVMTKGFVGLLPLLVISLYEIYAFFILKERKLFQKLFSGLSLVFGLLIISVPWHLRMYQEFGSLFIQNYFGYHVWDRATMAIEDKGKPFFWYITVLKVSMRLWFIDLLGALPLGLFLMFKGLSSSLRSRVKPSRETNLLVFLFIWSISVFLFFSAAKSKLIWYIMPIYPALGILIGIWVDRVLNFIFKKTKWEHNFLPKFIASFVIVVVVLTYLVSVKSFVYTSDLTGSQARLLMKKDEVLGTENTLYIDRMDLPLAMYYSESPFEIIDFKSTREDRVPQTPYNKPLILLTKSGRFSNEVVGRSYPPKIIQEDGDWILWYFDSEKERDQDELNKVKDKIQVEQFSINTSFGGIENAPEDIRSKYYDLLEKQEVLINKINSYIE